MLKKLREEAAKGPEPPDGYLEKFTDRLMLQVRMETPEPAAPKPSLGDWLWSWIGPFFQPKPMVAFATVAILVACGVFVFKQYSNRAEIMPAPLAEQLNSVDANELLAYAEEQHLPPIDTVPPKKDESIATNNAPIDLGAALDSIDVSEIEAFLEDNPADLEEQEEGEEDWVEVY